jgi:hypothetical protein
MEAKIVSYLLFLNKARAERTLTQLVNEGWESSLLLTLDLLCGIMITSILKLRLPTTPSLDLLPTIAQGHA